MTAQWSATDRTPTDGPTASAASATATAVAVALETTERILADTGRAGRTTPDSLTGAPGVHWHPLSIDQGDLGLAFLLATMDRVAPDDGWDVHAHRHLSAVGAAFADAGAMGPGLFGAGGVALAFRALDRSGTRYQRAEADVQRVVAEQLHALLRTSPLRGGLPTAAYDVASGVAGALSAAMVLHRDDPGSSPLVVESAAALANWACRPAPEGLWTPPSSVTAHDQQHRPETAGGYVDLGFAHGTAGVLAALGSARRAGVRVDALDEAITRLRTELLATVVGTRWGDDVPYRRTAAVYEEEVLSRTAWCYGAPGVALALAASARDDAEREPAERLWRSTVDRPRAARGTPVAGICHGTSGLLLVGRALGRLGVHVPRADLDALTSSVLDDFVADSRYGFRDAGPDGTHFDSAGFLQGAAGIAAALVASTVDVATPAELVFTGVLDVPAR